jgi:cell division septation protein DedD
MNEKTHFLKILKFTSYIVIVIIFVAILWNSRSFFDKNYNKHEILESDSSLYKVENTGETQEGTQPNIDVIEQQPIEIHTEITDVVQPTPESQHSEQINLQKPVTPSEPSPPAITTQVQGQKTPQTAPLKTQQPKVPTNKEKVPAKVKNDAKKTPAKNKEKQALQSPKTLAKPEHVAQSVMKNPLFYTYIVQVGAFSKIEEAQKFQTQISNIKIAEGLRTELSSKDKVHKVFIGYFENHNSAESVCITLKKQNVQCFVTKL